MATQRPALEVRNRLARLTEFGMTLQQIADCTGVKRMTLYQQMHMERRYASAETYDKVMAVDVI